MSLDGLSNSEVTGNTCSEGLFNAVLIRGVGNHVSGNRFTRSQQVPHRDQPGIAPRRPSYLAGGATGNTVEANEISGYGMAQHCVGGPEPRRMPTSVWQNALHGRELPSGAPESSPRCHARNRIDQLAPWDFLPVVHHQQFSVTPARIEPAREHCQSCSIRSIADTASRWWELSMPFPATANRATPRARHPPLRNRAFEIHASSHRAASPSSIVSACADGTIAIACSSSTSRAISSRQPSTSSIFCTR